MSAPDVYTLTGTARQLAEMGLITSSRLGKLTTKGSAHMRCGVVVERITPERDAPVDAIDRMAAAAVSAMSPGRRAWLRSELKGKTGRTR